jgi:tetratricopeptide (TPR) repeat protein
MAFCRIGGLVLFALFASAPAGHAADTLADAKRRAATELMREGKAADAVSMLQEVVRADPTQYRDQLQLARGYDKLNRPAEAAEAYHRAADLLAAARTDDRAARGEIDRRLKVLDAQTNKVAAAEDEFLKKLDALEREAIAAKDMRALERIFRGRAAVWAARDFRDGFGCEVDASAAWTDSGHVVQKGVAYRVRAAGYWTFDGNLRCTADGTPDLAPTAIGPFACLELRVGDDAHFLRGGTDATFVAPATGQLRLISNVNAHAEREHATGRLYVLVSPVAAGR